MSRTKFGTQPSKFEGTLHASHANAATLGSTGIAEVKDDFDDIYEDDTDFDVEEDIAFLGEEYDVMELDDVLELCNVGRDESYDA
jgi:hypothetical protein